VYVGFYKESSQSWSFGVGEQRYQLSPSVRAHSTKPILNVNGCSALTGVIALYIYNACELRSMYIAIV